MGLSRKSRDFFLQQTPLSTSPKSGQQYHHTIISVWVRKYTLDKFLLYVPCCSWISKIFVLKLSSKFSSLENWLLFWTKKRGDGSWCGIRTWQIWSWHTFWPALSSLIYSWSITLSNLQTRHWTQLCRRIQCCKKSSQPLRNLVIVTKQFWVLILSKSS